MGYEGQPEREVVYRNPAELRVLQKQAAARLSNAEAVLRRREDDRERALLAREDRFSDMTMKKEAATAARGLNLSNLDELRSLKFAPPPIVQLVARCVATLISGDEIGDAEAESGSEPSSAATSARQPSSAATSARQLKASQVGKPKEPPPETAISRLASPKQPDSARGRLYEPRETARPQSPRRLGSPRRHAEGIEAPMSAREQPTSARAASPRAKASVRDSDVKRVAQGKLVSWEATQKMLLRSDFKLRLMTLNAKCLLDNSELIENVRTCLDLSSIKPGQKFNILPGRQHAGDRDNDVRERRELVKALYQESEEDGVHLTPLKYEEARYVNEVVGAMLIWVFRIFKQYAVLIKAWKRCAVAYEAADARVIEAKKVVEKSHFALDAVSREQAEIVVRDKEVADIPKPTQLTTLDQIVTKGPGPMFFFTNAKIAGMAPRPALIPTRLQLPRSIHFYLRVKSQRVSFPFPPSIPTSQYLFEAQVVQGQGKGQDEADLVAQVPFDSQHVIGLADHLLLSFCQLVIEVPSTPTVNPTIRATRLSFHPRHEAQLHNYEGDRQRIIVPIHTVGGDRGPTDSVSTSPPRDNEQKGAPAPMLPVDVPSLSIPAPPPVLIGSAYNAGASRDGSRGDGGQESGRRSSRSSARGAWTTSRQLPAGGDDGTPNSARSRSPSAKKAAERVLAFRAEALMKPLIKRVEDGYVLTQAELRRFKRLVHCVEHPPEAFPTHTYSMASAAMLPSDHAGTRAGAPPAATATYDPRRQALLPSNNGHGSISRSSHSAKLSSLAGRASSTPRSGSISAR